MNDEQRTENYRAFVQTWARHCGAPRGVFVGQLDVTIAAEVEAATTELGAEIARLLADVEVRKAQIAELFDRAQVAEGRADRLARAFRRHRTATHEVDPTCCRTCMESDAVLAEHAAS